MALDAAHMARYIYALDHCAAAQEIGEWLSGMRSERNILRRRYRKTEDEVPP